MRTVHAAPADESVIRVEGILDGFVARRLEAKLLRYEPGARIHVDLTRIREFHDFGIAVLGQALARCRGRVRLCGLRRNHLAVLAYFGVETAPLERVMVADAA
jgi:anti-anti-sigma regulatory factor